MSSKVKRRIAVVVLALGLGSAGAVVANHNATSDTAAHHFIKTGAGGGHWSHNN